MDAGATGIQADPLNPGRGPRPTTPRPKGKRADIREIVAILDLAAKGVTQVEIARVTGIRQQAVSDICRRHESTVNTALGVLKANAHQAAVDWVGSFAHARKRGEHRPMRDALIAVGVVAPDPQAQGVTVIVGSGDVQLMTQTHSKPVLDVNTPTSGTHNPTSDILIPHEPL